MASLDGVLGLPTSTGGGGAVLPPFPTLAVADAVDFDAHRRRLVWIDHDAGGDAGPADAGGHLLSISRDGSNLTRLAGDVRSSQGATGLAVDWVTGGRRRGAGHLLVVVVVGEGGGGASVPKLLF